MLRQFRHGFGQQIAAGAAGHIVENHRHGGRVGNGGEMGNQTVLGGLVVIGGHHQNRVGARRTGGLGVGDDVGGVVGAGSGNDGNPSGHPFHGVADHFCLILRLNGGVFAGGSHDHQGVDAAFDLPVDKPAHGLVVNAAGVHRGHHGSRHTTKNGFLHVSFSFSGVSSVTAGYPMVTILK